MLDKINSVRISNDLNPLSLDETLIEVARTYSQEMIAYNFFDHISVVDGSDPFQRVERSGYYDGYNGLRIVAENLGLTSEKIDIEFMFQEWMRSSGHRANILNSIVNEIGIGIIQGNFQNNPNTALYTIIFTQYSGEETQSASITSQTSSIGFSLTTLIITPSTRTSIKTSSSTRISFSTTPYTSSSNKASTIVSTIVYLQQSKTRASSTDQSYTPPITIKEATTTIFSTKTSTLQKTSALEKSSSTKKIVTVNLGFTTLANPYPTNMSTKAAIPGFPPLSILLGFFLFLFQIIVLKRRHKASNRHI